MSLKAIAKQMGMTAPALYRYFASRDDLLTELILAAYRDLADVAETAAGTEGPARARLTAIAQAIRAWALTNAHRYLLIYGTPVPGYQAPPEATALASRIFAPVVAGFSATGPAGGPRSSAEQAMRRSLVFWTRLHGVISLEAAGHFTGMAVDPARLYAGEVTRGAQDRSRPSLGDPAKMAARMIGSVDVSPAPRRLVLGNDSYRFIHAALTERLAEIEAQQDDAALTDLTAESH